MAPDPFRQPVPEATDFTPLISHVSRLLGSDLKTRIRNDLKQPHLASTSKPAEKERVISAHDALTAAVDNLEKAKNELEALKSYVEVAEEYAREHLEFHSALQTYFKRTTNQPALQSESVAPIRKLPNEVLQLIFLEVHAQSTETERFNPVTAQVCTCWRQLAEATPSLWTTINVNLLPEQQDSMDAVAQMETRIRRARQRLVTLRLSPEDDPMLKMMQIFDAMDSDVDEDSDARNTKAAQRDHVFNAAITTLLQYTHKIVSLQITYHEKSLGDYLAKKCAEEDITFEQLRTLSVYAHQYHPNDAKALLKACPNVDRLRIHQAPDTPHIRWETMKEFKGRLDRAALTAFLSRTQDIQQAEISSWSWATVPTITFSNSLMALSLYSFQRADAIRLATVEPPANLRYLSLSSDSHSASILLRSWGSNLNFVALKFDVTAKDLKDLLPTIPNVQGLRLDGDRPTPPNLFSLVPKLTHLEICTGDDRRSEQRVQKLLARPLKRTSRGKRFLLRSVTFLPKVREIYFSPWTPKHFVAHEGVWQNLYRDLKAVDIDVHEYRRIKAVDGQTFNTAFFKERG